MFRCEFCDSFESKWPKNVTRHESTDHPALYQVRKDRENLKRPFQCSVCFSRFGQRFNLTKHKNIFQHWWLDSAVDSKVQFSALLNLMDLYDFLDTPRVIAKVLKKSVRFRDNQIIALDPTSNQWSVVLCDDIEEKFYDILQFFVYSSSISFTETDLQSLNCDDACEDESALFDRIFIIKDYKLDLPGGFRTWTELLKDQ